KWDWEAQPERTFAPTNPRRILSATTHPPQTRYTPQYPRESVDCLGPCGRSRSCRPGRRHSHESGAEVRADLRDFTAGPRGAKGVRGENRDREAPPWQPVPEVSRSASRSSIAATLRWTARSRT